MTYPAVNSEQVAALFAERQRYETWLATLESKRATTPPHIYHRVHADYTARLQRVIEQLATHRAVLRELEGELVDRMTSLDIEEARHRDEIAEAELRAAVGELTPEQHQAVQERAGAALRALNEERLRVMEELTRLRAVLEAGSLARAEARPLAGQVPERTVGAAGAGGAGGAGDAGASDAALRGGAAAGATSPSGSPEAAAGGRAAPDLGLIRTDDWDLSFEKTPAPSAPARGGASGPTSGAQASGGAPTTAPGEVRSSGGPGPFDDLEFLRTMVAQSPTGGGGEERGAGTVSAAEGASAGASAAAGREGAPAPPPLDVRHPDDSALPKEAAEQVKTLKCQECGALNYPTEWYCERCGAELAAL